jgi:hypothetical protein
MVLRLSSNHLLTDLCNGEVFCFLWGKNRIFNHILDELPHQRASYFYKVPRQCPLALPNSLLLFLFSLVHFFVLPFFYNLLFLFLRSFVSLSNYILRSSFLLVLYLLPASTSHSSLIHSISFSFLLLGPFFSLFHILFVCILSTSFFFLFSFPLFI